ncbi:3-ketosteroid reductase [Seiridium cupressi]
MAAPWNGVSSQEQYFVLITGANSGVGLAICQRMIDDYLATRSLSSHLILIPTTRSAKKSSEAINSIRAYLTQAVQSKKLVARAGPQYSPQAAASRVHVVSVELDLCKLPTIYQAAHRLVNGDVRDPTGVVANGGPLSIPRLDVAIFNAGYGGWSGLSWPAFIHQTFAVGPAQAYTFPSFKAALLSSTLPPQETGREKSPDSQPPLAEVFTANVFGHYILAHQMLPLLSRSEGAREPAGRIVWTSSIDAEERHLSLSDIQGFQSKAPYESSKRITDLISVTADLPSVEKVSAAYFTSPSLAPTQQAKKPRFYLTHPGIVCTPLFPLNAFLYFWYYLAMYLCRYLGSPWHTVETYIAACSAVWVTLAPQEELDSINAHRVKWGSACDRLANAAPKKTEVEGWGWEGKVEDAEAIRDDTAEGIQRKLKGRKWDAVELTEEKRAKFEEDAVECWTELERLRTLWEGILKEGKGS